MQRTEPTTAESFVTIKSLDEVLESSTNHFKKVKKVFDDLSSTRVMELLRHNKERAKYLLNYHSKVIASPIDCLLLLQEELLEAKHKVSTLLVVEAGQLTDFETFASIVASRGPRRMILIGNKMENPPFLTSRLHHYQTSLGSSMFSRLMRLNYPQTSLKQQFGVSKGVHQAINLLHQDLELVNPNANKVGGLKEEFQVINVPCKEVVFSHKA